MSQQQRILQALRLGPTCGTQFLDWRMPRYAARIHELRAKGYRITSEKCGLHKFHLSPQVVYRLGVNQ